MKRTIFALLLTGVVALTGVFATGQPEAPNGAYGRQGWNQQAWEERELGQEATLQGEFTLINGFPAIETSRGMYTLGAPRAARVASTIDEGTPMEVEGYLMDEPFGPRGRNSVPSEELTGHLRVTLATIDGETYEVAPPGAGPGMMGGPGRGRHGHMGGWNGRTDGYRRRW